MHVMGAALGLALTFGRTLPQIKLTSTQCVLFKWKYANEFRMLSLFDGLGPNALKMLIGNKVNTFDTSKSDLMLLSSNDEKNFYRPANILLSKNSKRTSVFDARKDLIPGFIPISLLHLVRCSLIIPKFH